MKRLVERAPDCRGIRNSSISFRDLSEQDCERGHESTNEPSYSFSRLRDGQLTAAESHAQSHNGINCSHRAAEAVRRSRPCHKTKRAPRRRFPHDRPQEPPPSPSSYVNTYLPLPWTTANKSSAERVEGTGTDHTTDVGASAPLTP